MHCDSSPHSDVSTTALTTTNRRVERPVSVLCKEGKMGEGSVKRWEKSFAHFHVTPSCQSTQSYTGPGSLYFFSRDARSSD